MRGPKIKASELQKLSPEEAMRSIQENFVFSLSNRWTPDRLENVAEETMKKAEQGDIEATRLVYSTIKAMSVASPSTVNLQQNNILMTGDVINAILKIRERIVWMINDAPVPIDRAAIIGRLGSVPLPLINRALDSDWFNDSGVAVNITSAARRDVVEMPVRVAARAITGGGE